VRAIQEEKAHFYAKRNGGRKDSSLFAFEAKGVFDAVEREGGECVMVLNG
jgi:hypothetical protein